MASYKDYGYDALLRKKKADKIEKPYFSQADTEVYIEGIGENKVKVNTGYGIKTAKEYVDDVAGIITESVDDLSDAIDDVETDVADHETRIDTLEADETSWHIVGGSGEPSFENSWTNFSSGSSFSVAAFRKDANGTVYLTGLVKDGTTTAAIFTLPTGYRPSIAQASAEDRLLFSTISYSAIGRIDVYADGTVMSSSLNNNIWVALDGISFKAA